MSERAETKGDTEKLKTIVRQEKEKEEKAKAEAEAATEKKREEATKEGKTEPKKAEAPKEAPKKEKKEEAPLEEKVLTVPLGDAWRAPRTRRTSAAIKVLRQHLERHLKKKVKVDISLNRALWARGIQKPPRSVRVKAKVFKEEVRAYPA